ncbi:MAG: hypothetical protein ACUVT5_02580 [Candidatus Bathyarchaeales archaeon]
MLGFYENFPEIPHAKAIFHGPASTETLQQAILKTLVMLNGQEYEQNEVSSESATCKVGFEFGIAEGTAFNYLDGNEIERFQKNLSKKTLASLDFFCVVKYYLSRAKEKQKALKFDYYLLRFIFRKPSIILTVFHERGTRRLSIEELINFLTTKINAQLAKTKSEPVKLRTVMCPVPIEDL